MLWQTYVICIYQYEKYLMETQLDNIWKYVRSHIKFSVESIPRVAVDESDRNRNCNRNLKRNLPKMGNLIKIQNRNLNRKPQLKPQLKPQPGCLTEF